MEEKKIKLYLNCVLEIYREKSWI